MGLAAGVPDASRIAGVNLFWIRYDQGRLDELVSALERPDAHPMTLAVLGLAYCELDRPEDARRVLDQLAVDGFAALPGNFVWTYMLTVIAEMCAGVGDAERAALLYDLLIPHQGLVVSSGGTTTGAADHYLGLLASTMQRLDDADRHFRLAAALNERIGAPSLLARTRLEWARMLAARGDAGDEERASTLLHQALATARELGLATVDRRAMALLDRP
jgi:tetratricopeptide (TPR) repeat protein